MPGRLRWRTPYPIDEIPPRLKGSGALLLCDPQTGGWRLGRWSEGGWRASDDGVRLTPSHFAIAPGVTEHPRYWPRSGTAWGLLLASGAAGLAGLSGWAFALERAEWLKLICGPTLVP